MIITIMVIIVIRIVSPPLSGVFLPRAARFVGERLPPGGSVWAGRISPLHERLDCRYAAP